MLARLMKIACLFFAGTVILTACAEPTVEPICEDNNETRPCTAKELAVINDVQYIIYALRNYEQSDPKDAVWVGREKKKHGPTRLFMFGEKHPEIIGRIQTLAEINALLKSGDVVLLEGDDRNKPHFNNCGLHFIGDILMQWQFEKLGKNYLENFKWKRKKEYIQLFKNTQKSYDLSGLSIADMKCGYWDDIDGIRQSLKDYKKISFYMSQRNLAMTQAIKEGLAKYKRVIINTGSNHMPQGDLGSFMARNSDNFEKIKNKNNDLYKLYEQFMNGKLKSSEIYQLVESERSKPEASRSFRVTESTGSSKVIYEFIKREGISVREAIHGKMVH